MEQEGEDEAAGPAGGWEVPLGGPPAVLGLLSSSGSRWGKPNAAWASSAPPYGVGYICGEAVCSIPHSSSLFSPIHIYPSVSCPHTRTDPSAAPTAQRASCGPTEQLGSEQPCWKWPRRGSSCCDISPTRQFPGVTSYYQRWAGGCSCLHHSAHVCTQPGWKPKSCFRLQSSKDSSRFYSFCSAVMKR